jgi:aromatic-amino-acid transaminase
VLHLIASHQNRPSDDPIFSLHKEATRRKDGGESIVDASIGVLLGDDGDLSILPTAARAVREVPSLEWATYAPIAGTPEFVQAVVDDLLAAEPEMKAAAVAVATPGGSGAIRHAITNFLEPGQAALTTSWFWSPYRTLCDESDRKLDTFAMFDANGRLDVGALDAALARLLATQGRALVIVNDPAHNPTGYSMTDGEWAAVAECVGRHGVDHPVTLLVDCAYFLYGAEGRDPLAFLKHLRPLLGRAVVLFAWSASKSFTHYGLRVGALVGCVGDPAERAKVAAALSYSSRGTWSNCNHGGLSAITRVLVDPAMKAAVNAERGALKAVLSARVEAFNRLAQGKGLRYPRYEGGFFVTVFVDRPREQGEAMKARGVFVVPQAAASATGGVLRVALCAVASRDVPRLVDALAGS